MSREHQLGSIAHKLGEKAIIHGDGGDLYTWDKYIEQALEVVINSRDHGVDVEGMYCERCGAEMELKGYLPWSVHGLEGDSELERAYYVCPECKGETIFSRGQEAGTAGGSLK